MTAIKKEELERLEAQYGLGEDGLTYQHRCSRITAYMQGNGDSWEPPAKSEARQHVQPTTSNVERHPLFGKRILLTPMMRPDASRNLAFDEKIGPEIVVHDYNAGEHIYGAAEDVQRMVGSYEIDHIDQTKQVVAKTTFPKIGTEISLTIGRDLVPVVRGNDNKVGYIWSFPSTQVQVEDTLIQLYGLKTLLRKTYPELERKFSGKPLMSYIDGVTLAADIPQTHAIIKEHLRQESMAEKAGLGSYGGLI